MFHTMYVKNLKISDSQKQRAECRIIAARSPDGTGEVRRYYAGCEVKWALESILESIVSTMLVEVMGFQLSYFKS